MAFEITKYINEMKRFEKKHKVCVTRKTVEDREKYLCVFVCVHMHVHMFNALMTLWSYKIKEEWFSLGSVVTVFTTETCTL